jgi:hypothetical protein
MGMCTLQKLFPLFLGDKNIFCNTTSATSFASPFQHYFCNIASTPPLQHFLLQQHFNITFVTPSPATSLLLLNGDEV